MRRPLFAVLPVLVAATLASGHSAAQGPRSAKTPAKAPAQKLESVMACMKYRQQRLVEDGGLRMELRNCCRGSRQVRDFVGGPLRRRWQAGREVGRSGDRGGQHGVRLRLRHQLRKRRLADLRRALELRDRASFGRAVRRRRLMPSCDGLTRVLPAANFRRAMRITANQVTIARLLGLPFVGALAYGDEQIAHHRRHPGDADRPHRHGRRLPGAQVRRHGAGVAAGSRRRQGVHRRLLRHLRRHGHHPVVGRGGDPVARARRHRAAIEPGAARTPPAQHQRGQGEDLGADAGHRVRRAVADRGGARQPGAAVRGAAGGGADHDADPALHAAPPLPADRVRGHGAGRLPRRRAAGRRAGTRASRCSASSSR